MSTFFLGGQNVASRPQDTRGSSRMKGPFRYAVARILASAIFSGPVFLAMTEHAVAQSCIMEGRTLEFGGVICGSLPGRTNCTNIHRRWAFVGDKVLDYSTPSENRGLVWHLGKEVDMTKDDLNIFKRTPGPGTDTATLKAELRGSDYILTRHNQMISPEGVPLANLWYKEVVRVRNCNSCELVLNEVSGNTGTLLVQETLTGNWCQMTG